MTVADFQAIAPLLILSLGAALVMLQIAFLRNVDVSAWLSTAVLVLAASSCAYIPGGSPVQVTPLLLADRLAFLFSAVFCLAGAVTVQLSREYIRHHGDEPEEYFLLLILSTLGACVLAYAVHLASLLLGLELMSIALYALIAYPNRSILPLEAATKYLVLSGAASATSLFGFALFYAVTGTLEFSAMGAALNTVQSDSAILMVGAAMIFAGMAFKLSVVPFHLWTPDVFSGAPAPVTGFLASVAKVAVFIALLRLFLQADLFRYTRLIEFIALMALLGMIAGNLLAILQTNIKRMLAFSSIAHISYLLVIFMVAINTSNRALALEAALFYLIAYTVTTLAAFGLLTLISATSDERENVQLQNVSGLLWRQPLLALLMMVALLSLAGIPLTAGFIGKFYLFAATISGSHWVLTTGLIVGSAIGIYYYLRVIFYMTRRPDEHPGDAVADTSFHVRVLCCLLIATILWMGVLPQIPMAYLGSIL